MKTLFLITLVTFFSVLAFGQNVAPTLTVKAKITDSVINQPISYATVILQDSKTQASAKSTLTKDDGSFELIVPADKTYQLVLVVMGYKNKTVPITGTGPVIDLNKVFLAPSNKTLDAVSVTSAKPLIKREVDRISYDVQADQDSKGLSALDMMRKVPLLSVDGNDNIKLKGSGNYKILINGKESALVAKNPSDILKSMPATNIERIEVITTPPAKYDAEGLSGLINIVTKKNTDEGYNVGMNTRLNSVYGNGINLNGTFKQGKFGMSLFGGVGSNGKQTTTSGNTENIFANKNNILQTATNTVDGKYNYGGAELSYEIDTLNLLTASLNFSNYNQSQGSTLFSNTDSLNVIKQAYTLQNVGNGTFDGIDASLNYQLGFKKLKDRLLTISYKYSYAPNTQFNDNLFGSRVSYPVAIFPNYQQYNDAGDKDHTVQIDYADALTKHLSIEAGAKAILRDNHSNYHVDDQNTTTQQYLTNTALTNNFNYHQDIYSVYNSYQLKVSDWTGKAGLRLERTDLSADFTSAGVSTAPSYTNLIPSVSVQRSFKTSSINFGYTQRIQRPGIQQLNPFVDRSTPGFINAGNPTLRPELDNTFELTYSNFSKNAVNIGLSYAFSNNSIQNVSSLLVENVNNKKDTVTYTTYQNLGTNKTLGLNVNTNMVLTKKFTLSLNGQLNHVWLSGTFNGTLYHNDGFTGNAFGNMQYKFDKGYSISFNAGYYSGNVNLQGGSSTYIFNQFLFSKEFLNKKMTLVLVANNPYSKYNTYRSTTNSADFYQTSYGQNYYRSLAVRLNFKFGKLKSEIKKNEHSINNDDTKSSGTSNSGGSSN